MKRIKIVKIFLIFFVIIISILFFFKIFKKDSKVSIEDAVIVEEKYIVQIL